MPEHVKTYRPSILLLCGSPEERPSLVSLASDLTRHVGLLICANVLTGSPPPSIRAINNMKAQANAWLNQNRFKGTFYSLVHETNFYGGVRTLIQAAGIGKLTPNIVMLGLKNNWNDCERTELVDYFQTIHLILDRHLALVIVALPPQVSRQQIKKMQEQDILGRQIFAPMPKAQGGNNLIDVWWLYDNGGLTVLLPYLLSTRDSWKGARLRIFTIANKPSELDFEHRNMAALLAKFRIDYYDLVMITDIMRPPRRATRREFQNLIEPFIRDDKGKQQQQQSEAPRGLPEVSFYVTEAELASFKEKTDRHLRLRESLMHYSRDSRLVVM